MTMSLLLRKLRMENKEFVTSMELKAYCRSMELDYATVVRYFSSRGYIVRVFRGIFYVKSVEEFELGRAKYSHLQLVSKGLELKKVHKWYFGFHTALKLNNMTHEHFAVEDVVSDSLFRANPVTIAGHKFRFVKLSSSVIGFGVRELGNGIPCSDPEKTVLDFIYVWRYNGIPEDKIFADVREWARYTSGQKLRRYSRKYPKTVAEIALRVAK
jgi:predicted transcriptional regulator of viral defense system